LSKKQWDQPEADWRPLRTFLRLLRPALVRLQRFEANIISVLFADSDTEAQNLSPLRATSSFPIEEIPKGLLQQLKAKLDNHVLKGNITIFARPSAHGPFKQLAADVLPILKIIDWEKGVAVGPDGTYWWSIHIQILVDQKTEPVPAATARNESAAIKALAAQFKKNTKLTRVEAFTWCDKNGFTLSKRGFQSRVWPKARELAGLPATARPGRKSLR
jgi:hypothetical protein